MGNWKCFFECNLWHCCRWWNSAVRLSVRRVKIEFSVDEKSIFERIFLLCSARSLSNWLIFLHFNISLRCLQLIIDTRMLEKLRFFSNFHLKCRRLRVDDTFLFFLILNRDKSSLGRISPHRRRHRLQSNDEKSHLVRADADACTQKVQIAVNFPRCCHFHHICRKCEIFFHSKWAGKKKVWDWFLRQIRKFIATQNCTLKALAAGSATTVPVRIKLFFYIVTQWQCGGIFMQLDFPNRFNCNFTFFIYFRFSCIVTLCGSCSALFLVGR